ncbi:hypothetical protein TcasGA2_TC034884 [Tribolium castaneum]|uniref:Uncharacterized protein n=1 Tax=Tribolium castaneum TaxID=7070 RepID=A0A139WBE2_TRICA|nr:hypothetical protein TcasGA2_TC034884 [Tribolium castaneum]
MDKARLLENNPLAKTPLNRPLSPSGFRICTLCCYFKITELTDSRTGGVLNAQLIVSFKDGDCNIAEELYITHSPIKVFFPPRQVRKNASDLSAKAGPGVGAAACFLLVQF